MSEVKKVSVEELVKAFCSEEAAVIQEKKDNDLRGYEMMVADVEAQTEALRRLLPDVEKIMSMGPTTVTVELVEGEYYTPQKKYPERQLRYAPLIHIQFAYRYSDCVAPNITALSITPHYREKGELDLNRGRLGSGNLPDGGNTQSMSFLWSDYKVPYEKILVLLAKYVGTSAARGYFYRQDQKMTVDI